MTANPPPTYGAYPPARHRPLGVTIIAILEILFGILMFLAAMALFVAAVFVDLSDYATELEQYLPSWVIDMSGALFAGLGIVVLVIAIIAFLLAWGFLKGKRWAWWLGVIFSALNILSAIITAFSGNLGGISSAIIPIIILLYLMLPGTKAWFNV